MTALGLAIWNFLINLFATLLNIAAVVGIVVLVLVFVVAAIYQVYEGANHNG